jgi:hypothetical protein
MKTKKQPVPKPAKSRAEGLTRLMRCARILRAAHRRYLRFKPDLDGRRRRVAAGCSVEGYDQRSFEHSCGTPACALGHYAYHTPSRWLWNKYGIQPLNSRGILAQAIDEFYLDNYHEKNELFGSSGCGGAKTALEAAKYIEEFVARERKVLKAQGKFTATHTGFVGSLP